MISFMRQLNNYGFQIETTSTAQLKISNPYFTKELIESHFQSLIKKDMKIAKISSQVTSQDLMGRIASISNNIEQMSNSIKSIEVEVTEKCKDAQYQLQHGFEE